jgi:thiosulfate/3-mercaptopyruvate sulfurtransferase
LTAEIHRGQNKRYGRPGHITSSLNIPFHSLVDPDSGKLVSPESALKIFEDQNISSNLKITNYCGGGIAATLNAFILYQLGFENIFIYDNSLSEWAMDPNLPMETC